MVKVIAEIGVNHNGDLELAKELIDAAVSAGADIVKFQTFVASKVATLDAAKAAYQIGQTRNDETQLQMLHKLELKRPWHYILKAYCESHAVEFLSTGFDCDDIDFLTKLQQKRLKVPSGEITNLPYLRCVGRAGLPIYLSTGMSTMADIEFALDTFEAVGAPRKQVTVLHCTTEYPAPIQDVNLLAMCSVRDRLGVSVGYSDHTLGIDVAVAATALGAEVIEKHLTMDRGALGPDHQASLEPDEFSDMVSAIRTVETALGSSTKEPAECELKNITIARRSIVAKVAIKKGELLSASNLTTKRPGTGLDPRRWDEILGSAAIRDFIEDELIQL